MSGPGVDSPRKVREGETLDEPALKGWLREHVGPGDDLVIEQFPGGHSNLTYALRWGDVDYVLRRPPFGSKVKSAHDMTREHKVLSALHPSWGKVPRPIALCTDDAVMGADFYLTERLVGVIFRKKPPVGIDLDETLAGKLCEAFVDTLLELHALDVDAIGLSDLGRPDGFVQRQVEGWTQRYTKSQTDELHEVDAVARWLADHIPEPGPPAIVHNDFKFDNMMFAPDDLSRPIAVLDWEMTTTGDRLMDLGTALCYWVQADDNDLMQEARFGPTHVPGAMTRREVADRYLAGADLGDVDLGFYYVMGLFKTAVVCQQIYFRFQQGLTKDPRFAFMIEGVKAMARQAARQIEHGDAL